MRRDVVTRDPLLLSDIEKVRVAEERHCCGLCVPGAHQSETIALCSVDSACSWREALHSIVCAGYTALRDGNVVPEALLRVRSD